MEKLWKREQEEVLNHWQTSMKGLSAEEAQRRLEEYGENRLKEGNRKGVLRVFAEQFADFLVIILVVAAVISAFTGGLESTLVIVAVLILNAALGTIQHFKAEKSLESLRAMSAPNARVIRGGQKIEIPALMLVPGDILLLEAGDVVSADGRILESHSLQVNESALTGESENVNKQDGVIAKEELALGDRVNMLFSGSLVAYGRGVLLVSGTAMDTEIGKIATLMESAQAKTTPLQRNLNEFSKKLSVLILAICALIFILGIVQGTTVSDSLMFAVALAVAAIPEALSSIVTIGLAIGTQKMAKENAIIKQLQAVESLGSVSVICSDKTGTLTQNRMTVQEIYTIVDGCADERANKSGALIEGLMQCSVLCNDGAINGEESLGDPTETALLRFYRKCGRDEEALREQFPRKKEIPFDSDRKLMSTLHEMEGRFIMLTKGAPDVLLSRCTRVERDGEMFDMSDEERAQIIGQNQHFSSGCLRVLAFAKKQVDEERSLTLEDENELVFLGLISMMDPPREESAPAVANCKSAGIRPVMITGDHKVTASAIAREIGILGEHEEAIEGSELERMSEDELRRRVTDISVYARVSPEHKIRIVRAWQDNGHIVAMTGDGVNDAPALKQADIGIAMGITGTEVSKDAAAMILTDDNFATIVKAVGNGRNVYANIKSAILFLLSGNLAGIITVLFTSFMGLPLPFTAVQLLFVNLLTDSLPALAINMEKPMGNLLRERPRNPQESILTKSFSLDLAGKGVLLALVTITGYYMGLRVSGELACTMAFATLCLGRLFHGFNCRGKYSIFRLKSNLYSFGAFVLGAGLLFAVILIPSAHGLFNIDAAFQMDLILKMVGLAFLPTFMIQFFRVVQGK